MDGPATGREPALDHLRALAMLGGVLFHAGLAHSVLMQPFWPGALGTTARGVDAVLWALHLVRMPLFFVVAGYASAAVLERRGMAGLARHRARRVLLPFLVAWPLLGIAMAGGIGWAAANVDAPNALLLAVREAGHRGDATLPPTLGHLWFLPYLLLFTVLTWAGRVLGFGRALVAMRALGPTRALLLLPLLLAPSFALTSAPHPAPDGLLPQLWAIGVYGPFFALGVGLHRHLDWLAPLRALIAPAALVVLGAHLLFLWRLEAGPVDALWPRAAWPTALLQALIAAWGTVLLLGLGLRTLCRPSPLLDYLSRSAYTVYLLHLPVLLALQVALLGRPLPGPLAFSLVVAATLAVCLLAYEFGVRRTPLRQWIG